MSSTEWRLTEVLSEEHRLIQRGLVVLARLSAHLRRGGEVHPEVVEACLRFLREFADQEHHDKEERILFPWLEQHGLSHEAGPLAVLRDEHEHVRDHVRRMSAHARHLETLREAVQTFVVHADELCLMFWKHLLKENEVLFPMAESVGGGTRGLYRWEEGRAQAMLEEHRDLIEHLERAAREWPIEDVRWPAQAR